MKNQESMIWNWWMRNLYPATTFRLLLKQPTLKRMKKDEQDADAENDEDDDAGST
ncbi:MAG: hypothetical protein U5K51_14320 [Flavobacteriaceae bacterium]|nr:hypothetical protein [Flavobacteriaceae bacterium]